MLRGFRGWAWVWAACTALAVFFAVSTSLTYVSTGRQANWSVTLARALSEWWLWALLTPLVVRLARRFPLHGASRGRSLLIHAIAGCAIAFFKTLADRAMFALISGFWMYFLASTLALQFVIYAVIVAATHGLEYYRRSREREQLERRLTETRLQLLNMQLQPHFLFNTLNTIAELVHEDLTKMPSFVVRYSSFVGTADSPSPPSPRMTIDEPRTTTWVVRSVLMEAAATREASRIPSSAASDRPSRGF